MSKIRTAVMGLGWVACHRHIPALLDHDSFQLVGVIDPKADKSAATQARLRLPFAAQAQTLDSIDWLDQIDAIVIATPPATHTALALQALAQGKHVLVEKPFACDAGEANALTQLAQTHGKILASAHNLLFCRAVSTLKRDIDNGVLGPLSRLAGTHLCNPRTAPPDWHRTLPLGAFSNECPHLLYLAHHLTGGSLHLRQAHGVAKGQSATPDHVHMLFSGPGGLPVTLDYQFDSSLSEWHLMVMGEKATAFVDLYRDIYVRLPNDGAHRMTDVLRTSASAVFQHGLQHATNGLALLTGRLDYGTGEVYDRFAHAIETGLPDEMIGDQASLAVANLQSEVIKTISGNMYS